MNSWQLMLIGMVGSITTSVLAWWWLRGALRALLTQLCDKPGSTDFWLRYMLLMLLIVPMTVVALFSPEHLHDPMSAVRRLVLIILLGQLAAFALIGRSLFKTVREQVSREPGNIHAGALKE